MKDTTFYTFLFGNDSIEIKCKEIKTPIAELVLLWVITFCFFAAFIFLGVCGIVMGEFAYSVIAFPCAFALVLLTCSDFVCEKKRMRDFRFLINGSGVVDKEINSTYAINWKDIVCWGFVNDNYLLAYKGRSPEKQICMYFSAIDCGENTIRKRCNLIQNAFFKHKSSKEIIVLGFKENGIDKSILNALTEFINNKIDSSKTRNFLRERKTVINYKKYLNCELPSDWRYEENEEALSLCAERGEGTMTVSYLRLETNEAQDESISVIAKRVVNKNKISLKSSLILNEDNNGKNLISGEGTTSDGSFVKIWVVAKHPQIAIAMYHSKQKNQEIYTCDSIIDSFSFNI